MIKNFETCSNAINKSFKDNIKQVTKNKLKKN